MVLKLKSLTFNIAWTYLNFQDIRHVWSCYVEHRLKNSVRKSRFSDLTTEKMTTYVSTIKWAFQFYMNLYFAPNDEILFFPLGIIFPRQIEKCFLFEELNHISLLISTFSASSIKLRGKNNVKHTCGHETVLMNLWIVTKFTENTKNGANAMTRHH